MKTWSRIGLGCGPLGAMDAADAVRLVHGALALGVTVFDTAPSYGASEHHLGEALRGRDAVVVTKGGYGIEGCPDWTPACISRGVDRALSRLGHVDVFLLHSCEPRDELVEPLVRAREAGKVGAIGYSGDGAGLAWAASSGAFDVLECSLNVFDQENLAYVGKGRRVLAKRSLGNAPWRDAHRPERADRAAYWDRMWAMFDSPPGLALALGFVLGAGVDCALVGTTSVAHLQRAAEVAPTNSPQLRERWAEASKGAWHPIV